MSDSSNIPSANGKQEHANGTQPSEETTETSLIDILLIVSRNLPLIGKTVIIVGVLGIVYALLASSNYTSSARVIREVEAEASMGSLGGLSLLKGIGLNLGGSSMGLTPEAYPDVLNSREVRLAVVRDTFFFSELGRRATFTEFTSRRTFLGQAKRYTIRLPRTILNALRENTRENADLANEAFQLPTDEEENAMKAVSNLISTSVDSETGLMVIASKTKDPILSAELTNSFVQHLVERIETIRTEKSRRDLDFIRNRYAEAQDSLRSAENKLARFDDRNTNPNSARLKAERARHQRQVTFKSELYSDLQAQLTQAEIDLQRSRPVITILEHPVPPIEPSGPRRLLLVIASLFLGAILGICLAFTKAVLESISSKEAGKAKINEIKKALSTVQPIRRVRRKFNRKTAPES